LNGRRAEKGSHRHTHGSKPMRPSASISMMRETGAPSRLPFFFFSPSFFFYGLTTDEEISYFPHNDRSCEIFVQRKLFSGRWEYIELILGYDVTGDCRILFRFDQAEWMTKSIVLLGTGRYRPIRNSLLIFLPIMPYCSFLTYFSKIIILWASTNELFILFSIGSRLVNASSHQQINGLRQDPMQFGTN